jgi:hypothetical protein
MDDKFLKDLMEPQDQDSFYMDMVEERIRQENDREEKAKVLDQFMQDTAFLESSGGKNFNHAKINQGIHAGHRAAGTYGFMPNTVQELIRRKEMAGQDIEAFKPIYGSEDAAAVKQFIETNPELEDKLARTLAEKVLKKTNYDPEKAQYMWQYGHNMPQDRVNELYQDSDRVKKYRQFKKTHDKLVNK